MGRAKSIAVVGATGAVGLEMMETLEKRNFPVSSIKLLASARSAGKKLKFKGEEITVEELTKDSFKGIDIALFSAGGSTSEAYAKFCVDSGAVMIDNSSAFRMLDTVPLVIPEINAEDALKHQGIIANPNCTTAIMAVAVYPLHKAKKVKRLVAATYQAASGGGAKAMQELIDQSRAVLEGRSIEVKVMAQRIAFNLFPHIDVFKENGYTKEEMKMVNETKKIMKDDSIAVTATTVRVPVFYAHSESINIETEKKITAAEVRELLEKAPGVKIVDDPRNLVYPLAIDAVGRDETFVGRIREDESITNGINMWVVSDNLRKGAALNAVQIAEILVRDYL